MVIRTLDHDPMLEGHQGFITQTLEKADTRDRNAALFQSFFASESDTYYIGSSEGLKGLLVCLAGVYVPQSEDLSHGVSFDPLPNAVDMSTSIVEMKIRGPDSASVGLIHRVGLSVLSKELSLVGCSDVFDDFGKFCLSEAVDPRYIAQQMRHVPQIGEIEWFAHHQFTNKTDNALSGHSTAA